MGKALSARVRQTLRARDGDDCFYCGRVMKFEPTYLKSSPSYRLHPAHEATIEHLVDRQHGGANDASNLVLACKKCNSGRNYMSLAEKLASRVVAAPIADKQVGMTSDSEECTHD